MLDFDVYIRRIGLDPADKPTWQAIHRAHATKIPFENLDSHRGIPISLEQADLERKLVTSRRGGYCFEHNLLLASALEHMGLGVEPMLARVRADGASRQTRPASPRLPDRHRGEQLVGLHPSVVAVRVPADRGGQS
jgi:N-hydroxyarylamine O-acetyltransferase